MSENQMPYPPPKSTGITIDKALTISSIAFGSLGALLNLAGVCILQINTNNEIKLAAKLLNTAANGKRLENVVDTASAANDLKYHVYDDQWFHTFFYIAVIVAFALISLMGNMADHRLTLIAFLAIGFVYLTSDMSVFISGTRTENLRTATLKSGGDDYTVGGPAVAFAGCFFMIISWFAMMIQTGGLPRVSK